MWGDFVGSSLLTDEDFKRLASELESGLIAFDQARAARLEAEIGQYLDAARYGSYETFLQNCSGRKNAEVFNQLHYEMGKSNLCYSKNRKDIETMFLKNRVRWPYTDNAPSGSWNCPECNALNQYVNDNKPVAYCRCCGQAVDMNYYRRHANG